ncbi:ATPase [Escherichia coli]|nr:ATPase [Escherichia coli]OKT42250.1 ATPase [Escherichia coli]
MKLKKLPGFSLGLIALAVGNAYATQLLDDYSIISYMTDEESPIEIKDNNPISNGEYLTTEDESHAVKVDDGVTGYINNASVMTREGANKRGNSSRLTQSFHFFMFESIFSPVNALNQPI